MFRGKRGGCSGVNKRKLKVVGKERKEEMKHRTVTQGRKVERKKMECKEGKGKRG